MSSDKIIRVQLFYRTLTLIELYWLSWLIIDLIALNYLIYNSINRYKYDQSLDTEDLNFARKASVLVLPLAFS